MSEDAVPKRRDEAQEVQDLRQFFYPCPVGLLEIDDNGLVYKVNPAAVAILAPALGRDDLAELFPVLDRLAPQMSKLISGDRGRMGPLVTGERILVPAEVHGTSSLEIRAVRVAAERVMVVLLDVSAERRLAAERDRRGGRDRPLPPGRGQQGADGNLEPAGGPGPGSGLHHRGAGVRFPRGRTSQRRNHTGGRDAG